MKPFVVIMIVIGNFILQSTVFEHIRIMGVKPNTLIPVIISFALLSGSWYGILAGVAGGLLWDIIFSSPAGLNTIIFMFIGYLAGLAYEKFYDETFIIPFIFTFFATIAYGILTFIITFFLRMNIPFYSAFADIVITEAVYNSVLSIFIYYAILRLYKYKFMRKKWNLGKSYK